MKINVKNKTAASSLKRKFIETAQNACNAFMMPGGLLADWNVADVKHGKIPNGAWKFRGPRPVFSMCRVWSGYRLRARGAALLRFIPLNTLRRYLRYGYGLDIADPKYRTPCRWR